MMSQNEQYSKMINLKENINELKQIVKQQESTLIEVLKKYDELNEKYYGTTTDYDD